MRTLRRLIVRLRGDSGFTLTELVTVMAVLSIVVGTLVTVFVSGLTTQRNAVDSLDAQRAARVAMDRMRREVHCASEVVENTSSVTLTLPAGCPSPETSVVYLAVDIGGGKFQLQREGRALVNHLTTSSVFSYMPPTSAELARLAVSLPVNVNPGQSHTEWRLDDEIVLRNSQRVEG
jgi:prepilin-type N-terminal cleavage/methylation domain-containing protein